MVAGLERNPAPLGTHQVAAGETTVHAAVLEEVFGVVLTGDMVGARVAAGLVVVDRQRLVFVLVHERNQAGAPLAVHLERVGIDLLDHLVQPGPGLFGLVPVGGAVGVLAVGIIGQHHDGAHVLADHHRAQAGTAGLLGAPDPFAAVLGRLGNIEVMAVDATVTGGGRSLAGGHEGQVAPVVPGSGETGDYLLLQVEDLVGGGNIGNRNLVFESVDHDHHVVVGPSADLQRVETGILEEGPEIAAEVGDPGDAGQRGE